MSDIKRDLFRISDDFAAHMRLLDIMRSEGQDTGPLEQTIAEYFTHDVTREKIDSVIGYIRYCETMADAALAESQRTVNIAKSYRTQVEWLKDCAKGVLEMSGQKRLEGLTAGSLTLRAAGGRQAVEITNASLVPEEFVQYEGKISGRAWQVLHECANGFPDLGLNARWFERTDVQMERIPQVGQIGEALARPCACCQGTGEILPSGPSDAPVEVCTECSGDGLARVPGARLKPRGNSVVLR